MFYQFFKGGKNEVCRESSKLVSNFRAQGTIEYLVVLAVVVVLALVVVGLVVNVSSAPSQQISSSGNNLGLSSQGIGITESLIEPNDGNFVVRLLNNSGENLTISNVSVGDSNVAFSEDLAQGGERFFVVATDINCSLGKIVSEDVVITYVTRNGLTKTERYPSKVMFNCTPYSITQANLADQCPSCPTCEECADPVVLHSGQTISYDSGALDDKDQDGTAKSYTDNINGTVTDNHTGLVWQKDDKDNCSALKWENALSYCSTLASGSGGLTDGSNVGDWRVPSVVELITLVDYSYPSSSDLDNVFTQMGWESNCTGYWSSTTLSSMIDRAYVLGSSGYIYSNNKDEDYPGYFGVRCVRSG